jgi:hypothetical protein
MPKHGCRRSNRITASILTSFTQIAYEFQADGRERKLTINSLKVNKFLLFATIHSLQLKTRIEVVKRIREILMRLGKEVSLEIY